MVTVTGSLADPEVSASYAGVKICRSVKESVDSSTLINDGWTGRNTSPTPNITETSTDVVSMGKFEILKTMAIFPEGRPVLTCTEISCRRYCVVCNPECRAQYS